MARVGLLHGVLKGIEKDEYLVITNWREIIDWSRCITKFKRLITIIRGGGVTKSYLVSDTLRLYTSTELVLAAREAGFSDLRILCYVRGLLVEPSEGISCSRLIFVARN